MTEDDKATLEIFNTVYAAKDLEYIETGYRTLIPLSPLQRLARDFLRAVVGVVPMATGFLKSESGRTLLEE